MINKAQQLKCLFGHHEYNKCSAICKHCNTVSRKRGLSLLGKQVISAINDAFMKSMDL